MGAMMVRNSPGPAPRRPEVLMSTPLEEKNLSWSSWPSATTTLPDDKRTAPAIEPNTSAPSPSRDPNESNGASERRQDPLACCAAVTSKPRATTAKTTTKDRAVTTTPPSWMRSGSQSSLLHPGMMLMQWLGHQPSVSFQQSAAACHVSHQYLAGDTALATAKGERTPITMRPTTVHRSFQLCVMGCSFL